MSKNNSSGGSGIFYALTALIIISAFMSVFSLYREVHREEGVAAAKEIVDEMVRNAKHDSFFYLSKSETGVDDVYVNMMGKTKADLSADGGILLKCNVYVDGSVSKPQVISVNPGFEAVETRQQRIGKGIPVDVKNYAVENTESVVIRDEFPDMCDVLIGRSPSDPIEAKTPVSFPAG